MAHVRVEDKPDQHIDHLESSRDGVDDFMDGFDLSNAEMVHFDFEGLPPSETDKDALINLLTQMFLRAMIDLGPLVDKLIQQSPFGCVYKAAEECGEDNDSEGMVYGVLSMVSLISNEKYSAEIWELLTSRALKYGAGKAVYNQLIGLRNNSASVGLFINERLLNFPASVSRPAFASLRSDIETKKNLRSLSTVLLVIKIRICEDHLNQNERNKSMNRGKAARKMAAVLTGSNVIFDNTEEEVLFKDPVEFDYFDYPVQSDVEKDSKFSSILVNDQLYRPYRRVCVLSSKKFQKFLEVVSDA